MKLGRKTKLTPSLQKRFCEAVESGMSASGASRLVGITVHTYQNWMRQGEQDVLPYADFYKAVQESVGRLEEKCIKIITRDMTKRDAKWILSRYHDMWQSWGAKVQAPIPVKPDAMDAPKTHEVVITYADTTEVPSAEAGTPGDPEEE